eukprot:g1618.t1
MNAPTFFVSSWIQARRVLEVELVNSGMDVAQDDVRKHFETFVKRAQKDLTRKINVLVDRHFQETFPKWTDHPALAMIARELKTATLLNTIHLNAVLPACLSSKEMIRLIRLFVAHGISTNNVTYNLLSRQILVENENDPSRADEIVRALKREGLIEVPDFFRGGVKALTKEDISKAVTRELIGIVKSNRPKDVMQILRGRFDRLLDEEEATRVHLGVVMQNCDSPSDAREVMERARSRGLHPDASTYSVLMNAYVLAGQFEVARGEILREMVSSGILPNKYTRRALDFSPHSIGRRMTAKLRAMRERGEVTNMKSFFHLLLRKRIAKVNHLNLVLDASDCASQSCELLERVLREEDDEVGPLIAVNAQTLNILIRQLVGAGRFDEARVMIDFFAEREDRANEYHRPSHEHNSRRRRGERVDPSVIRKLKGFVEASEYDAKRLLDQCLDTGDVKEGSLVDRRRVSPSDSGHESDATKKKWLPIGPRMVLCRELDDLIHFGDSEGAIRRYREVLDMNYAEISHLNNVLKVCTFEEGKSLLAETTKRRSELTPDAPTYNTLLNAAKRFGTDKDCEEVLRLMSRSGVEADAFTERALALTNRDVFRLHVAELRRLVKIGREREARNLFERLASCGKADVTHMNAVLATCTSVGAGYALVKRAGRSASAVKGNRVTKRVLDGLPRTRRAVSLASSSSRE